MRLGQVGLRRSHQWKNRYDEIPSPDEEYKDRYVYVIESNNNEAHAIRDQEWFVGVFRAIGLKPTK